MTGKLLPAGNPVDVIEGAEKRSPKIGCGNLCCSVKAADFGIDGTILRDAFKVRPDLL
jgi:2-methylaconitate cis-trans-isomerase PrpF